MTTKFSQFTSGGTITAGDQVVGLRNGTNTRFTAPAIPVQPWTTLVAGQQLVVNNGYFLNNPVPATYTLPLLVAAGEVVEVITTTAQICTIAQNAGQQIQFGALTTTVGVGGSLASTGIGQSVFLICNVANTSFTLYGPPQGIWTVT